ncbi:hypothetical protein GALL_298760 [mine drainage metagenome]|uniref:Uncharacterized protein n=1 Tax=mine drainage metagenome TaxID=410659 RepID=A0A1J5RF52_9ZZZZ
MCDLAHVAPDVWPEAGSARVSGRADRVCVRTRGATNGFRANGQSAGGPSSRVRAAAGMRAQVGRFRAS